MEPVWRSNSSFYANLLSVLLAGSMYVCVQYNVQCTMYIHVWHVIHAMYAHIAPKRYSMGCSTDLSKENTDFSWTLFTLDPYRMYRGRWIKPDCVPIIENISNIIIISGQWHVVLVHLLAYFTEATHNYIFPKKKPRIFFLKISCHPSIRTNYESVIL